MLTFGSQGPAIKKLQSSLNAQFERFDVRSIISVEVSGIFDEETLLAVKYLQCAGGLPVDGRVDNRTLLFAEQGAAGLEMLSIGSRGTAMKAVQHTLASAGIRVLIDGQYGQFTELGVRQYQQNLGLVSDGLVKVETWERVVRSRLKSIFCIALLPDPYSLSN